MKLYLTLVFCLSANLCFAQDSVYVRKTISKLTSEDFWGRGYIKDGMQKSANFIEAELKSFKVKPLDGKSFKQNFSYPVNTFPATVALSINGKSLKPGVDFIVNPASRGAQVKEAGLEQKDSVNFLNIQNRLLLTTEDKLTFSVAREQADFTQVLVKKSSFSETPKQISVALENVFVPDFKTSNVCGVVKGTKFPDSLIVLTAHYDHLGGLGSDTYFPGANDNASGVSFLLSLAKYYAQNPQEYSIAFIFFAGEEAGLVGSQYFAENPLIPLTNIKLLFNFDLVGTGEDDATVVNATVFPQLFAKLQNINNQKHYLKKINQRGKAPNSDHYPFSEKGVPSFFLYTQGGISAYHDVFDKAETLPLSSYNNLFQLVKEFNAVLMN